MARTVKILTILFYFFIISADVKSAEVIKAEPIFTTTSPIIKPHIVEPPSKPVQTLTPDINYVPKINQNTNVPVVKNATLNITTTPVSPKTNTTTASTTVNTIKLNTPAVQSKPAERPAINLQSSAIQNTTVVKPVSSQSSAPNPAVVPQMISFQKCTKIFPVDSERLFYLSLASITANRFNINEIQSKSGYILFSVRQKQFLLSIATVDKKNAIVKITPANNNYYFPEGIVTNIFKYIDLNTDTEISKI